MCSKYEEKENINAWIVRIFDAPDHGDPALEYNSVGRASKSQGRILRWQTSG